MRDYRPANFLSLEALISCLLGSRHGYRSDFDTACSLLASSFPYNANPKFTPTLTDDFPAGHPKIMPYANLTYIAILNMVIYI
jgi:hypothetical protein